MQLNQLSDLKKRLEESIFSILPVPIPANRTLSLRHDTGHLP